MPLFDSILLSIPEPDARAAAQGQGLLDGRRSLGSLEELACRFAALTGRPVPPLPGKAVVVRAADHRGEGSGAARAFGLVDAAQGGLHEMATFTGAGVPDRAAPLEAS